MVSNPFGSTNSSPAILTLLTNLTILHDPFSITRKRGTQAAFRVAAEGAQPITYQWFNGTNPISAATNDTLWLSDVEMSDDGSSYHARVANPFGSTDSAAATLGVVFRPVLDPIPGYLSLILQDHPALIGV